MSRLTELRGKISQLRQEALEIMKEAGPDKKYSADMLANLRTKNAEMDDLGKQIDDLVEAEKLEASIKARETELETAAGKGFVAPTTKKNEDEGEGQPEFRSLGQLMLASETYRHFMNTRDAKTTPQSTIEAKHLFPRAEMKAPLTTTRGGVANFLGAATATSTAWGVFPQYLPGVTVPLLFQRPVVADLIPQGTTTSNSIVYMMENTGTTTNGALTVLEGALKPESAVDFSQATTSVTKIATVLPVTEELLQDQPAAQAYIDNRLRVFLALTEEAQLLNGNGTGSNLRGILQTGTIQTIPVLAAEPTPDAIFRAMTSIRVTSFLEPTGIVMHPNNWRDIRLLRTADGIYIWGSPSETAEARLWGMNIVQTPSLTAGTAIVGAFDTACQIFRRTDVGFAISDQHADFFQRNMLMLKVEERLAFVIYRPAAFAQVTGL